MAKFETLSLGDGHAGSIHLPLYSFSLIIESSLLMSTLASDALIEKNRKGRQ
jgi:hypothetical protein